ncbi:DUF2975 domain-containing protein [Magnetospirillum aberrantis]|uniref:DUF2975 domain-containing protein n=1 Tax=Magnetospirillum aberrantis SpK TaxID=908842 RepID=A0A7C9QRP3_9PROT|nr:DUF2975 domain-containing protein [Magnetospirillum aberrantis]NFV78945.1 DUF2975 domain-containing protein [Magnetospirillum aberrantis SpK]
MAVINVPGMQSPLSPRLARASRLLSLGCLVAVFVLPVLVVGKWALDDPASLYAAMVPKKGASPLPDLLEPWQRGVGAVLSLVPTALAMVALLRVRRCFDSFAAGLCFDGSVVTGLRGFAGMSALSCAAGMVLQPPLSALLSWQNPAGQRFISIGVGSDQVGTLFFAAMVWIIAAVMAKAVAMARENAEFV